MLPTRAPASGNKHWGMGTAIRIYLFQRPSLSFSAGENFRNFYLIYKLFLHYPSNFPLDKVTSCSLSQGHLPCPELCSQIVFVLVAFRKNYLFLFKSNFISFNLVSFTFKREIGIRDSLFMAVFVYLGPVEIFIELNKIIHSKTIYVIISL